MLTERLSASPGIRAEIGSSDLGGSITYYPDEALPATIDHEFVLAGVNVQYKINANQNLYAGWSQAYRPVILKDIVPSSTFERVDDNLKDADGYNLEAGSAGPQSFSDGILVYFSYAIITGWACSLKQIKMENLLLLKQTSETR